MIDLLFCYLDSGAFGASGAAEASGFFFTGKKDNACRSYDRTDDSQGYFSIAKAMMRKSKNARQYCDHQNQNTPDGQNNTNRFL
jgi:hypothetical protein